MATVWLRLEVNDWRDVPYDSEHARKAIMTDILEDLKYQAARRAEDNHDIVVDLIEDDRKGF